MAKKLHVVWVWEWTYQFTSMPIAMLMVMGTKVIDSTVPLHRVQSHKASGSYSHKMGRFGSSEVAHSPISKSCFPLRVDLHAG
mmetsp:Transcript_12048/g.25485  ORF Transcript_12048/g.25485 Transcript_12048/m.25485 type:complete len:83 (-) Transcript_12048:377-625(-)